MNAALKKRGMTLLLDLPDKNAVHHAIGKLQRRQLQNLEQIHFLAVALLDDDNSGRHGGFAKKPRLLVEINYDGDRAQLKRALYGYTDFRDLIAAANRKPLTHLEEFMDVLKKADHGAGTHFKAFQNLDSNATREVINGYAAMRSSVPVGACNQSSRELWQYFRSHIGVVFPDVPVDPRIRQARWLPRIKALLSFVVALLVGASLEPSLAPDWLASLAGLGMLVQLLTVASVFVFALALLGAAFFLSGMVRLVGVFVSFAALESVLTVTITLDFVSSSLWLGVILTSLIGVLLAFWSLQRQERTLPADYFVATALRFGIAWTLLLALGADVLQLFGAPVYQTVLTWLLTLTLLVASGVLLWSSRTPSTVGLALGLVVGVAAVPWLGGIFTTVFFWLSLLCAAGLGLKFATLPKEEFEACEESPVWDDPNREIILAREAGRHHNHLLSVVPIKPGRWFVLWLVLQISKLELLTAPPGRLSGIATIHYARWVIVEQRYLLFLSNYDGAWEAYLDEFVNEASDGLSAIWSNCKGFPQTRWLTGGGARSAHRFKQYARKSLYPTDFHYFAYDASVSLIEDGLKAKAILENEYGSNVDCETLARLL